MTTININSTISPGNVSADQWTWSFRSITVLTICSLITILTILGL